MRITSSPCIAGPGVTVPSMRPPVAPPAGLPAVPAVPAGVPAAPAPRVRPQQLQKRRPPTRLRPNHRLQIRLLRRPEQERGQGPTGPEREAVCRRMNTGRTPFGRQRCWSPRFLRTEEAYYPGTCRAFMGHLAPANSDHRVGRVKNVRSTDAVRRRSAVEQRRTREGVNRIRARRRSAVTSRGPSENSSRREHLCFVRPLHFHSDRLRHLSAAHGVAADGSK